MRKRSSSSPIPPERRRGALRAAVACARAGCVLLAAACLALDAWAASGVQAETFVPLEPGDSAHFRSYRNGARLVAEVDAARRRWVHYTEFAGLGDLWVFSPPSRDAVYVRKAATMRPRLLVDFAAPVGSRFRVELPPCNVGAVTLAARGQRVTTPVGSFDDTALLELEPSCAGGVTRVWFARGVGAVRFERLAEDGGDVPYTLVAADVGDLRLAPARGIEVSAAFPGPVLDLAETLEVRSVCDVLDPSDCGLRPVPASLEVELTARNRAAEDLEWQTPTDQLFEITLFDIFGNGVSRWSRGRRVAVRPSDHVIPAGQSLTVQGRIELADDLGRPLPPGSYTLAIEIFGIDVSASAPLDIVGVAGAGAPAAEGAPPREDAERPASRDGVILGRVGSRGHAARATRRA